MFDSGTLHSLGITSWQSPSPCHVQAQARVIGTTLQRIHGDKARGICEKLLPG